MPKEKTINWEKEAKQFLKTPGLMGVVHNTIVSCLQKYRSKAQKDGNKALAEKYDYKKYNAVLSNDGQPCTDGKTVFVSIISTLYDTFYRKYWRLLTKVATVHEVYHLLLSDFDDMTGIREWIKTEYEKYGYTAKIYQTIATQFLNALEDGRIEAVAISDWPGLYSGFRLLNHSIRAANKIEKLADEPQQEFHDFFGSVLSYAKTGTLPEGYGVYKGTELDTYVYTAMSSVDEAVYSKTSKDCRAACETLLVECAPYIVKLLNESAELQDELEQAMMSDEYAGASSKATSSVSSSGRSLRGNAGQKQQSQKSDEGQQSDENGKKSDQGENGKNDGNENQNGKNDDQNGSGDSKDSSPSEMSTACQGNDIPTEDCEEEKGLSEDELQALEDSLEKDVAREAKKEVAEAAKPMKDGLSDTEFSKMIAEEYVQTNHQFREEFVKYPARQVPTWVKGKARMLRAYLEKLFKMKRSASFNKKQGRIDTRALWKPGMSRDDFFYHPGKPNDSDSCCAYVLIDNSGSMDSSAGFGYGRKFEEARLAGAIFEEALKGFIPLKIALFHCGGMTSVHTALKAFDSNEKNNACYSSITEFGPTGCNEDSVHINYAITELLKRSEKKKLLFILSDGTPSAYGNRGSGLDEVKKAVAKGRKNGIRIIPIMFGDEGFLEGYADDFKYMYDYDIVACNPREVSTKIPKLLEKYFMH